MTDPEGVGEALDRYLRQMGSPPAKVLGNFEGRWPEVVGPVLGAHCRPGEFVGGVLTVMCEDSTWASQVTWSEGQIRIRIGELFDGLQLKGLRVKIERSEQP